jgi:hypothetical protein
MKEFLKDVFKSFKRLFTEHPNSVGESYIKHCVVAIFFSISLLFAGVVCLIHAIFPFLFVDTASSIAGWIIDTNDERRNYYE